MNALTTLRDTALRRRDAYNEEQEKTLLGQAVQTALTPLRVATSRPALKVYLTTFLFFLTSLVLISISTTAYFVFYYNYIPQIGLTQVVYLQYDANVHPHATIAIDSSALISQQPYDVSVTLTMPRTHSNLAAGNFMVDLSLLPESAASAGPLAYILNATNPSGVTPLARSRRPAILPYNSYITSLPHKLLQLPIHLLSLKDLDASELKISLFERLSFPRGRSNIPATAYLEIQSQTPPTGCPPSSQPVIGLHLLTPPTAAATSTLQIYSAQLNFHARFQGLRYYVYNYRTLSFLIFSTLFYMFAVSSMAIAWAFITAVLAARDPKQTLPNGRLSASGRLKAEDSTTSDARSPKLKAEDSAQKRLEDIKAEDDSDLDPELDPRSTGANLSSTERTFPTLGRSAQPLRYVPETTSTPGEEAENIWATNREDATHDAGDEDDDEDDRSQVITPLSGETQDIKAEDEDEEDERFRDDSGIGTSMESEAIPGHTGLVRRRSSRRGEGRAGGGSGR